jgi:NitT/TauT family transport system ATP-binding protein
MPAKPVIQLKNLTKTFTTDNKKKLTVLKNFNLKIYPGEFFIFLGPSGCGKSTALRLMCGLDTKYSGKVELASDIQREDISFVFQQFALLPWLTVKENVAMGLLQKKLSKTEKEKRVHDELKRFRLSKFAKSFPHELSGGMRQRVGIARAFATHPKIIFMDEPFSEVDSFTAEELRQELLEIWAERKPTIIMVTHLIQEAIQLADRIACLATIPSHIRKIVANKIPRPRNKRSTEFFALEDQLTKIIRPE